MPDTDPASEFFNNYLKSKFCWWVAMRYVVPFEKLGVPGYIKCEQDIDNLLNPLSPYYTEYIFDTKKSSSFLSQYVDITETDSVNSISRFLTQNSYTPDPDITLDEIKVFRTWLAKELLKFDQDNEGKQMFVKYDANTTHMLDYYAHTMYNEVVKQLQIFGSSDVVIRTDTGQKSDCGCSGSSNISSLYGSSVALCDALAIYRGNIRGKMIEVFSNVDFWLRRYDDAALFIAEFKKYVDNIIKVQLKLVIDPATDDKYTDCGCNVNDDSRGEVILKRLSQSLGYILDRDVDGHRNYISDALRDWSTYLYEHMYWV